MIDISDCLGQRVLVSINGGQPVMTNVAAFTPSGQYVWLRGTGTSGFDETVGWRHVAYVQVLETFGASSQTEVDVMQKLEPALSAPAAVAAPAPAPTAALAPSPSPAPVLTVTST